MADLLEQYIREQVKKIEDEVQEKIGSKLKEMDELLKSVSAIKRIPVIEIEKTGKQELAHNALEKVIKIISGCKRAKANILLVGGCGGGKSYLCKQVAGLMNIDFYCQGMSSQTTKSDLMGFINANGGYVRTPLRNAYENGGLICLDEIDAGNSNVLMLINNVISMDEIEFPDGKVKKHNNFWIVCTANTYGRGATIEYVGRNRLDAATLDRFTVVTMDYDLELEKTIVNCDKWMSIIEKLRANAEKYNLKVIISPRASQIGADMYDAGISVNEIIEMQVLKGSSDDIKNLLMEGINE